MIASYTVPQFKQTAIITFGKFRYVATSTSKSALRYVISGLGYNLPNEECDCEMCRLMEEMEDQL